MYVLETKNLCHRFSEEQTVLNGLNLQVPTGSIYGFLGKNGAGKTTTLKLLLGLLKKQQGEVRVFNRSFEEDRLPILRQTGSLIESPSIYGHLSAAENLLLLQKIYGCKKDRIAEVLALTGLTDAANKKAGKFSLGMKQRLGIAMALLNGPQLLILDEPTNGLDPNGIIDMRGFLKKLNAQHGITILISSHLLIEVEKLATHVGVLDQGKLAFQGTLAELMAAQQHASVNIIDTSDNHKALGILKSMHLPASLEQDKIVLPFTSRETLEAVSIELAKQRVSVAEISTHKKDLESVFIDLIKN